MHTTVEYFSVDIITSVEEDPGGENPFVLVVTLAESVHLHAVFLQEIPVQSKGLTFPGFAHVAGSQFMDTVAAVKITGQQVIDPV